MKNFKQYLACLAIFALVFTSCSKDENVMPDDQQTATLTFGTALQSMSKAVSNSMNRQEDPTVVGECIDGDPAIAQITLEYGAADEEVTVNVPILGNETEGYFTAYHEDLEIPIPAGQTSVEVELTDFVVWTDDDNDDVADRVLWVAPKADSEYAQFVTNPLEGEDDPYTWNLRAGSKTYADVEVLCFDNRDVNRYGYEFFDITPGELQNICFFANYCPPSGKHEVANYDLNLWVYTGTPENEPNPDLESYTEIYADDALMPEIGLDTETDTYYADPLCLAVPVLGEGEYLYYEATIEDWTDNYVAPENHVVRGYLDQADIDALVTADEDNNPETMDYLHLFFNCGETPVVGGDCPGGLDIDMDGVCDDIDDCVDPDGDGLCGPDDDCPNLHSDQDANNNCQPDADEPCQDTDLDGVCDDDDLCEDYNDHADADNDGVPDGCDSDTGDVLEGCETAYMEGNKSFYGPDLEFGNERWGWAHLEDDEVEPSIMPMWAAAGQNDTSKGYHIGNVVITNDNGTDVNVSIELFEGNSLDEVKIFFSNDRPETTAPGQYGTEYDPQVDGFSYDFTDDGDGDFWLIVHGDACPSEED